MEVDGGDERKPRGFGKAFVELFHELGYNEGDLHADMFDWLYGLPSLRVQAFLDWFLTSIRPRQSVKRQLGGAQDYAVYTALLQRELGDGRGILTGEDLLRAELACQSDLALQDASLDALEDENAKLEREIREMEHKLRLADEKNDRLAKVVQRRTLQVDGHGQRARRHGDKEHFNEVLAQIVVAKPNENRRKEGPEELMTRTRHVLNHLVTSNSTNAMALTSQAVSSSSLPLVSAGSMSQSLLGSTVESHSEQRRWKDFLYQNDLERLQLREEANLRALQARIPAISSLSFPAPFNHSMDADVSMSPNKVNGSEKVTPQSPWLHESDPIGLNMREQDAILYNKCCVELERLRRAYVVGEQDALMAQLQVTRYEQQLRQVTSSRRQLVQQFQLMSQDAIWARKRILQASLDKTRKQLGEILRQAYPEKLENLAFLKSTTILLESYEQKLWRQQHRFLKLTLLLEGFEMQHARLRLVHRILDSERQDLLRIEELFFQLITAFKQLNEATERRIASYDTTTGSDAARDTFARTYVNEHDEVAHRLFDLLENLVDNHISSDMQVTGDTTRLRTFDELVRLSETKVSNDTSLRESTRQIREEWNRLYDSKRRTLNQLRAELFGDSASSTPMLLPEDINVALREAIESKDQADANLEKALETLRQHKRNLQADPIKRLQQERDMIRLMQEIKERL